MCCVAAPVAYVQYKQGAAIKATACSPPLVRGLLAFVMPDHQVPMKAFPQPPPVRCWLQARAESTLYR